MSLGKHVFVVAGNPLLDLIVCNNAEKYYNEYGLKPDDAILAEERHMSLYSKVELDPSLHHQAGGAALNTAKMFQWLNQEPEAAVYFGCIGDDDNGKLLSKNCDEYKLKTIFKVTDKAHTGKCAVITKGENRSMVTHLGAALHFDKHLTDEMNQLLDEAKIYYVAGYFMNTCVDYIYHVSDLAAQSAKKLMAFNFSAPFLPLTCSEQLDLILPKVDILFGNLDEAREFAKMHKLEQSAAAVCEYFCQLPRPVGGAEKSRVIVITNGSGSITYQISGHRIQSFEVQAAEKIVDTDGAGDAFVAGFLLSYARKACVKTALEKGSKCARHVLGFSGFQVGDRDKFTF